MNGDLVIQLPFTPGMRVVELGGGANPTFHPNVDVRQLPEVDIVADLNGRLPIEDGAYDGVYSQYAIEHLSWRKVEGFVREMARILKPTGVAAVMTANFYAQCLKWAGVPPERWELREVSQNVFGDQNYEGAAWVHNAHFLGFSPQSAATLFLAAGFSHVEAREHPRCATDMLIFAWR